MGADPTKTRNCIATAAAFVVADLGRSVKWYTEQLNFTSARLDWSEHPTFCIVEFEGAAIMLKEGETSGVANRHHTPGEAMFDAYIWVRDLDKLALTIKVCGTPVFAGPTRRSYGCTELMFVDPDDYLICFGHCP